MATGPWQGANIQDVHGGGRDPAAPLYIGVACGSPTSICCSSRLAPSPAPSPFARSKILYVCDSVTLRTWSDTG